MEPQTPTNNNKALGIGIGVTALVLIGAIAIFGAHKSVDTTTTSSTETSVDQTMPAETTTTTTGTKTTINATATTTTTPPTKVASIYKDGTYSATGSYMSPGGLDHLGVTLTIKDDVVTTASLKMEPGDKTSARYQEMFANGYSTLVVGKKIDTIHLTKVSGSSLTPAGFNDALTQIEAQAKA